MTLIAICQSKNMEVLINIMEVFDQYQHGGFDILVLAKITANTS